MNEDDVVKYIVDAIKFNQFALAYSSMLCYKRCDNIKQVKQRVKAEVTKEEWKLFKFFQKHVSSQELYCSPIFKMPDSHIKLIFKLFDNGKVEKAKAIIAGRCIWKMAKQEVIKGHLEHTKFLLEYEVEYNICYKFQNEEDKFKKIEISTLTFCVRLLSYLINELTEVNSITQELIVSDQTFAKMTDYLLTKAGKKIHTLDLGSTFKTLLHQCIEQNYMESIKVLLKHQMYVNYYNTSPGDGKLGTPLDVAIEQDNYEITKLLVQNGATDYSVALVTAMQNKITFQKVNALLNTADFLKNTGYFIENKVLSDKQLNDSIVISNFIQNRHRNFDDFNKLMKNVNSKTLLSQLAYEFRLNKNLLCFYIELVQLEIHKLQLSDQLLHVEANDQILKNMSNIEASHITMLQDGNLELHGACGGISTHSKSELDIS